MSHPLSRPFGMLSRLIQSFSSKPNHAPQSSEASLVKGVSATSQVSINGSSREPRREVMAEPEATAGGNQTEKDLLDQIEKLRTAEAAATRRADEADRRAQTAEGGQRNAERRVVSEAEARLLAQEQATDNAIAAQENERTSLRQQKVALMTEGKYEEVAELDDKLADIAAQMNEAKRVKTYLVGEREKLKTAVETAAAQPQENGLSREINAWIEAHPRFKTDPQYNNDAMAGHYDALRKGIKADSPEYFAHVEVFTGDRQAPQQQAADGDGEQGELTYEAQTPQSRAAGPGSMSAAPPSRQAAASGSQRGNGKPDLKSDEREVADALYSHIANPADRYQKYADNREYMAAKNGTGSVH